MPDALVRLVSARHRASLWLSLAGLLLAAAISLAEEATSATSWETRSGFYSVSYSSELTPIAINHIHNWVFHIETPTGDTVEDAVISVTGGMPEHNHGLPTSPRMTRSLGNGDYLLEGMRFHMNGYWELTVTIEASGRRDTVVLPLTI